MTVADLREYAQFNRDFANDVRAAKRAGKSVADLHSDANLLGGENSLTEKGAQVPGNQHDILTGSQADGTLQTGDAPCGNWTSDSTGGAMVGHHNKMGGGAAPTSWNAAHSSKGCSQQNLVATGGNGYFYCFAN